MRDKYKIVLTGETTASVIYSYGNSIADATSNLDLADFLPKNNTHLWDFFDYCKVQVSSSPGHHAFFAEINAFNSSGNPEKLYVFVLHEFDPPDENPAFGLLKTTSFGFDYDRTDEIAGYRRTEFDIKMNPRFSGSEIFRGDMDVDTRCEIARILFDENYDDEAMDIGVIGFAESGLMKTVGAFYLGAEMRDNKNEFYVGRLPNINPENMGLMILDGPEGFSL